MRTSQPTRRGLLAASLAGFAAGAAGQGCAPGGRGKQLSVVCVGGHPDDPESGCGGTLARYSEAGHKVSIVYLTRGERRIPGKSLDEAARIRTAEAQEACRILKARPVFAGQIDGATELNSGRVADFTKLLAAVHRKLGNFQSGKTANWNDNATTGGHYLTLQRTAQFERGPAQEEFVFKMDGQEAVLIGYHIASNTLITSR